MRVSIKTLGCKVNQAESDLLLTAFQSGGVEVVDFEEVADCYIVNSCAVTEEAERKTRQYLRRAMRKNPEALVLLVGCYAKVWENYGYPLSEGRVVVLSSDQKEREVCQFLSRQWGIALTLPSFPLPPRARAWVKVEDGCDHFCSFCLVPYLRGRVRSRDPRDILEEVQHLEKRGIREIVLCGINLGYFGRDRGSTTLIDLVEFLVSSTQYVRFRLSSLEPYLLSEDFIVRYFALGTRVCPHLHLPLQSGNDKILMRMQRGYSQRRYRDLVETIRSLCSYVAITTDVIVGFPGETEEDFQETVCFCQEMGFSRLHVFAFSPRPGTTAFEWEKIQGVPKCERQKRVRHLLEVGKELSKQYYQSFVGKEVRVLVESFEKGVGVGHSENYIPVQIHGLTEKLVGDIVPVRLERVNSLGVEGRVIK